MGLATGWALRRRGVDVTVYEQFRVGHGLTSLLVRSERVKDGTLTADPASIRGMTIALPPERGGCLPENRSRSEPRPGRVVAAGEGR